MLVRSVTLRRKKASDGASTTGINLNDDANERPRLRVLERSIESGIQGLRSRWLNRGHRDEQDRCDPPDARRSQSKNCHAQLLSNDEASMRNYSYVERRRFVSHRSAWRCVAWRSCATSAEGISPPV